MTVSIRPSGSDSLPPILDWLRREYENDGDGFYGNREIIRRAHEEGALTVLVEDDEVVAFMVGDASSWDILEVRPDRRGSGHGNMLAQHYIEEARRRGVCVLKIQCSPRTSIPFWKKMGFTMFPFNEETQDRAYLVLDRSFSLPNDRTPVNVSIAFYPESKRWDQKIEPVIACSPDAVQVSADEIMLSARVICFDPHCGLGLDPVVGIEVNGDTKYLNKIKYEKFGVQRDIWDTFYLDRIILALSDQNCET